MKNIGIFGIGCIGSILTKYLVLNTGNSYFFFNRSQKHEVRIQYQQQITTIPIQISNQIDRPLDWIIICLKEYQIERAMPKIKELIHAKTKLAVFRNGIQLAEDFTDICIGENILETIIDCPTQQSVQGDIIQLRKAKIIIPKSPIAQEFITLFTNSDLELIQTTNFKTEQWKKLIESSSLGSLQALAQQSCIIFNDQQKVTEYIQLINEAIAVAQSIDIHMDNNFTQELVNKLKQYPDSKGSSMLSDRLAGKQLELDAKIGAIVNIAAQNNIYIPTTCRLYNLLLQIK